MGRVLDMMWATLESSWTFLDEWLTGLAATSGGATLLVASALVAVVLAVVLLMPRRSPAEPQESRPELLVSRGEVRYFEDSRITGLTMHVSNLGDGVAQLLEVALSSDLMPDPEIVELSVLVPRSRSVDVDIAVEELHGDSGFLDLFFYVAQTRSRIYRLRARLIWEPWNGRFKVDPLGQRIDPARNLPSSKAQRRRRQEWRRRQRRLEEEAGVDGYAEAPAAVDAETVERESDKRERLEFPSDF